MMRKTSRRPNQRTLRKSQHHYLDRRIRCGDLERARSFLENLSPGIRRELTEDSYFMFTAVRQNMPEYIRFLVEQCSADVDEPFQDYADLNWNDEMYPPLCYAAHLSNNEAAVELMRLGANVNVATTQDRMAALHFACSDGNIHLVKKLIQRGADLTTACDLGQTALMHAVHNVHVCRVLIESGTDVNAANAFGNTPLHYAIGENNPEILELLIRNGADMFKKNYVGQDTISFACVMSEPGAAKVLMDHLPEGDIKRKTLIRYHQLFGACCLKYSERSVETNLVAKALLEWEAAIRIRDEGRHITADEDDDVVSIPNAAHDNAVEIVSMSKLDEIRQDEDMIYMQGLLLMEKILGPTRETFDQVIDLALYFIRRHDYGHGLRLMRHGFRLSCNRSAIASVYKTGLRCVSRLCNDSFRLRAIDIIVDFKDINEFLETVTLEAIRLYQPMSKNKAVPSVSDETRVHFMRIVLYLIKFFCLLTKNETQICEFKNFVYQFVRLNLRSSEGRTFLMNAISPNTPEDFEWFRLEPDVVKLLLECGANAGERDFNGNSALHLLTNSNKWSFEATGLVTNKKAEKKVAEMLLTCGAHFDARNNKRLSAVNYLQRFGLDLSTHMTLQCLAARVIRRHRIPYAEILTKTLKDFVDMH